MILKFFSDVFEIKTVFSPLLVSFFWFMALESSRTLGLLTAGEPNSGQEKVSWESFFSPRSVNASHR